MRIGFDAIHLSRSRKGAARFEHSIIQTLASHNSGHHFVIFLDCDRASLKLPICDTITYISGPAHNLLSWEQFHLPLLASRYQVHCLLTLADRLPLTYQGPIVTYLFEVPDYRQKMAIVTKNRSYQRVSDILTRLMFPRSLRRAARIAAASHATGRDLQEMYGVSPAKIDVVYGAADDSFQTTQDQVLLTNVRASYGAPGGYVLHFSTGDPRDNTAVALAAFADARLPSCKKLILAGGADLENIGLASLITELGLSGRVITLGFQIGQALVELYQAADAYIDPSMYEGFGFQVLEAMACGVPVVCSSTTSLPEVVGDAAITCDPHDVESLAYGLEIVVNNREQSEVMLSSGIKQASKFSWQRTARELVGSCERAAG